MRSTMRDIARRVGVSLNTVSKAINGKPGVSAETRRRILQVAEQLNYIPNSLARGLASRRTKTIGVIVGDNSNPFFAGVIRAVEDTARERGYSIILCNTDEKGEREREGIRLMQGKRVDGVLLTPVDREGSGILELKETGPPFVLVARHIDDPSTDYVISDCAHGAYLATNYLIDRGYRRIAHIGGPPCLSASAERVEGYRKALGEREIPFDRKLLRMGNLKIDDGYNSAKELLEMSEPPDAIFAFSDFVAVGVLRALWDSNLKVPDDIALMGYDDIEFAPFLGVPLTTIHQPRIRMGRRATEILIEKIEGREADSFHHIVFKPTLVVRKSC